MKRRIISSVLSVIFVLAFSMTYLSGCKSMDDKNHYTNLQWLEKVEERFNLLYYTQTEPLVTSVKTSDEGFETVQIAAEWGIISPEDDLKFNDRLTKEFAADTLIRAMNCAAPAEVDISDSKNVKSLYLENVKSSVNEGIFELNSGKFDPKKQLTVDEADSAMITAYYNWINFSYGNSFDKSTLKENVINLGGVNSENSEITKAVYSVEYTGSRNFFDENGGYTDNTGKTITFPAGQMPSGLAVDTVLAMPADDVVPMNYAVVVTSIKTNDDGSATVSTRNAELQDVYEEIYVQQSGPVDFSQAIFYGPDGQRINFNTNNNTSAGMSQMVDEGNIEPVKMSCEPVKLSESLSMPLDQPASEKYETLKVENKFSTKIKLSDNFSITISAPLNSNGGSIGFNIKGEVKDGGEKFSGEIGFDESIKVENCLKTRWEWFQLKVEQLRLSMTETQKKTFGFSCSSVTNFGSIQNSVGDSNHDGQGNIGDWATEAHKLRKLYNDTKTVGQSFRSLSEKAKAATNKKLLDVVIPNTNLHFVIRAELTIEGSLKLTLEQSNMVGVELFNGKLRPIQENTHSEKLDFSAKIELTFRAALEFQLIGINVADIGCKLGVGAKVSSIVYSYDKASDALLEICGVEGSVVPPGTTVGASNEVQIGETALKMQTDETRINRICQEVRVYPIFTVFGCSSSSVAGSLFGSIELEVLGENNPFLLVHYEINENGGGIVSECSATANKNYGITTGDKLTLNMDEYSIDVGKDADTGLKVVTVPKDASIKDINITSDNTDVLEVENLLHKVTADITPSADPKLKIKVSGLSYLLPKKSDVQMDITSTIKIGTWFYQDMSESSNPQFALTGKKDGMANVTITVNGESVTVPIQVGTGEEGIVSSGTLTVREGTFTLSPGQGAQTAFDFIPEGKTMANITFRSDNTSVATVGTNGYIKAVGAGDAVITATLKGEEKEYTAIFTVHVVS